MVQRCLGSKARLIVRARVAVALAGVLLLSLLMAGCVSAAANNSAVNNSASFEVKIVGTDGIGPSASPNESGIVGFSYSYSAMTYSRKYSFEKGEDGIVTFTYMEEGTREADRRSLTCEVDPSTLDQLEAAYLDCKVAEWDGFNKSQQGITDLDYLNVAFSFADGSSMSAQGYGCHPDGYATFVSRLDEIIKPYV